MRKGDTILFETPPRVAGHGSVGGRREAQGPLAKEFDILITETQCGEKTWEKAESTFARTALETALHRAGATAADLCAVFAGDLQCQCTASAYLMRDVDAPYLGLYGACSTMAEGLGLAACMVAGGMMHTAAALSSSHFCAAERQFRTPLDYGGKRTPTAQWTVTGAGAAILAREGPGPYVTHCTLGKITDKGITDTNNMGAAMAPAAYATLTAHFQDTGRGPDYYDLIVTGDLGKLGRELLLELFRQEGVDLSTNHNDCGLMIFDLENQDVHCGGSGCGCSASVLTGYLLNGMREGRWKNILFCPTGALHSPTSAFQGESVPGICHAIAISAVK